MRTFTLEELAEFDGRDGKPAYVAYDGLVYDVSAGPTWMNGDHLGHSAGEDLTDAMGEAPHGEEVFEGMPVVGKVAGWFAEDRAGRAEPLAPSRPGGVASP